MRKQVVFLAMCGFGALQFASEIVCAQETQPVAPPAPQPAVGAAQPSAQPYSAPVVQPVAQPYPPPVIILPAPEPPPSRAWADPRYGFELTLGGPNGQFGGGFAMQPIRWVELLAWASYASANASGQTADAYAKADIKVVTGMARARIWPLERHSVVIDTGLGLTNYSMSADGYGIGTLNAGDTLHYQRKGTPGLANVGVGYGYRSNAEFRILLILGAMVHTNKLPAGTVTSTGSFTSQDREDLRVQVDHSADKLTEVRAYIDISIGFLF